MTTASKAKLGWKGWVAVVLIVGGIIFGVSFFSGSYHTPAVGDCVSIENEHMNADGTSSAKVGSIACYGIGARQVVAIVSTPNGCPTGSDPYGFGSDPQTYCVARAG